MRRALVIMCFVLGGCDDSAIKLGVGSECTKDSECKEGQHCLTDFKGGYCGIANCMHDTNCPAGSACVTADNGTNYCFLVCADKPECNVHRTADNESSCVSSLTFVDGTMGRKTCRPPSSGTATPADGGSG